MDGSETHAKLREVELQIAETAAVMERLRDKTAELEAKGLDTDDHHELLRTLGAAQSLLVESRELLGRRLREQEGSSKGPSA
jgi:hypothetical protein